MSRKRQSKSGSAKKRENRSGSRFVPRHCPVALSDADFSGLVTEESVGRMRAELEAIRARTREMAPEEAARFMKEYADREMRESAERFKASLPGFVRDSLDQHICASIDADEPAPPLDVIAVTVDTEADLRALMLSEPDCWRTVVTVRTWGKRTNLEFSLVEEGAALVASCPIRVPCAFTDFAYWTAELDPAGGVELARKYGFDV